MSFPYERYAKLTEAVVVYYPIREKEFAQQIARSVAQAVQELSRVLQLAAPSFQILLVDEADWAHVPYEEEEERPLSHPYWTNVTSPPSVVVPLVLDAVFGEPTTEKLLFMLYHALTLAFLENDPRPWPDDYPLWADEWQLKFAALWLSQRLDGVIGVVNKDLHAQHHEIFEVEADGKTPITIRGFDWEVDTVPEEYLQYGLLLERFAADLLIRYSIEILPRFLTLYRQERGRLLSDEVTEMLATVLGTGGSDWLEELGYF